MEKTLKIWRGKKRLAKKLDPMPFRYKTHQETLQYLLEAKIDDLVGTCDGFNHLLKQKKIFKTFSRSQKTWIISKVRITDEDNRWHFFPGGGCVTTPLTIEEIHEEWLFWMQPENFEEAVRHNIHYLGLAIQAGKPITDHNGLKLKDLRCQ